MKARTIMLAVEVAFAGVLNADAAMGSQCPAFKGRFLAEPVVVERVGPNTLLETGVPGIARAMFLGFGARDAPRDTPVEPIASNEFFARMDENRGEIVFAADTSSGALRTVLLTASDGEFRCIDRRIELRDSSSTTSGDGGKSRTVEKRDLFVDGSGNLIIRFRQQRERRDWLIFHRSDETTVTFRYARVSR